MRTLLNNNKMKKVLLWTSAILIFELTAIGVYWYIQPEEVAPQATVIEVPLNVIILIGDGMGPEHLELIQKYEDKEYNFETCPNTLVSTGSATLDGPTDSAAAASAIATGQKVNNGVISMQIPGDESELPTLLEQLQDQGKSTALVTTTQTYHATPAAFAAHTTSRGNISEILEDYFSQSRPAVIMGGQTEGDRELAKDQGYTVITTREELLSLELSEKILGSFGTVGHIPYVQERDATIPSLLDMTEVAIEIINTDEGGFFIMIEGGRIDHASHINETEKTINELKEFMEVAEYVYTWAQEDGNTMVVLTADHETGALELPTEIIPGVIPTVTWGSGGHSAIDVPLYICAPDTADLTNIASNTDIYDYIINYK